MEKYRVQFDGKHFLYDDHDKKNFNVGANDIIVKSYSRDGKTMTFEKLSPSEYQKYLMDTILSHYEKNHGGVIDALADL